MIVRHLGTDLLLITQPDHAALAARIMEAWRAGGFPDRPTRARVLDATRQHDLGWQPVDAEPAIDPDSGLPYEFTNAPLDVRQQLWPRAIDQLAARDPYVAALVAQHALTVYRRFAPTPGWDTFFPAIERRRDDLFADLATAKPSPANTAKPSQADTAKPSADGAPAPSFDSFLQDYVIVGLGDLFSLIFCNGWTDPYLQEDYRAILHQDFQGAVQRNDQGWRLTISPDPFAGAEVPLDVEARRIPSRRYASDEDLRQTLASAPTVHLTGVAAGAPLPPIS
jgi:hypothetical protein